MSTSGHCECKNGNQCKWTAGGLQQVNCPCFDPAEPYTPPFLEFCTGTFGSFNCGYETTCNVPAFSATCKCPDGTTCLVNDSITANCPCMGPYEPIEAYRGKNGLNRDLCISKFIEYQCPPGPDTICRNGNGKCRKQDGTWCVFGNNYQVNCLQGPSM